MYTVSILMANKDYYYYWGRPSRHSFSLLITSPAPGSGEWRPVMYFGKIELFAVN